MKRYLHALSKVFLLVLVVFSSLTHAQQPTEVAITGLDATRLKAWVFHPADGVSAASNPENTKPKRGTVVALHGCGGLYAASGDRKGLLNARHHAMAEILVEQGYNVVFPDSLTPRGESSICVQPIGSRHITQKERRADALATLAWVAEQPWADAGRVAVLGWSHGGSAVLAATNALQKDVKDQQLKNILSFKTAIAFYPGCADSLKNGYRPNTPLTLFLGADDDWTPPIPCMDLAKQLQVQKYQVELNVYEGAVHDFDNPVGTVVERKNIPSRLHAGQGVKAGANPVAREKAYVRLREILKAALE
jgi:dienelactone hydrolase